MSSSKTLKTLTEILKGVFFMAEKIKVRLRDKSGKKGISLVDSTEGKTPFYLSITPKEAKKGTSFLVPDNQFFNHKINPERILELVGTGGNTSNQAVQDNDSGKTKDENK